ncbi:hypothetical protein N7532_002089 [Penicillium argentinense]|uniref:Pal1 cell morphology protein n=1 Tax=Penicillium argentinense TaxID=1131581 RepID=A0A9W9KLV3_9EURO|nr:uncharacterized protein N7532_002089 [Penicillium argentinense]KAJ5111554.1 hypothetical protein N7532_002089 [Penicillium argentinense]
MNAPPALGYPPGVSLAAPDQVSPTAASFGSNNPFRNRALSPSGGSTTSSRPERPRSTNPFLDDTEALSPQSAPGMTTGATMFSPTEKDVTSNTRDLFENLSLNPKPSPPPVASPETKGFRPPPSSASRDPRCPPGRPRPPREPRERPSGRPVESRPKDPKDPFDIFADPPSLSKAATVGPREKASRRPRRNSESSVMERASKLFDDDDDRRRRERRHRDRDGRPRDGKSRSTRKDRRLDIIDKLDVTSIYGTGMFHHDGPFDACNPHRNRKGSRIAPMQAFPKNSTNMALGGSGPNNSNIDLNLFHGRMEEGYNDFSTSGAHRNNTETVNFDPRSLVDPIHGSESAGLGTSTFLDGAPASRSAMARRRSENEQGLGSGGGLQRKKSLAQRLRGKSGTGRMMSPTEQTFPAAAPAPMGSSHSASSRGNETNPFFQDYNEEYDKKATRIQETRLEGGAGRMRSSSSPKQPTGLERKSTNDRASDENKLNAGGGGFLNRMKSLRKPRPERRTSD